ncbi:hypothetical protein AHF37_00194 [Paragonimus kellicotti]|nr:hypothetical protein AHF37_00194 [Paragonimus kellicotti]
MLLWIVILGLGVQVGYSQPPNRPPDPKNYENFEVAKRNMADNMCPYLSRDGKQLPVVCWMCTFPYGMHPNNRYVYGCCPGYERSALIDNKCVQMERSWKNIPGYLKDKGNVKTAIALTTNTAIPDLVAETSKMVYTVFVPKEDDDITKGEADYTGRDNSARMLVAKGRYYSNGFRNGQTIKNENSVEMKITFLFQRGMYLVFLECRMFLSLDHETVNGIVHFVDGALPATGRYPTVLSRLMAEPDLSQFTQALPQDLRTELDNKDSYKWFTVFAPTNDAWSEMASSLPSGKVTSELARQLVIDKLICSGAITQKSSPVGPTKAKGFLQLTVTRDGKPALIDDCSKEVPFSRKDLMSGNGVVHVIEKPVNYLVAMDLSETLGCLSRDTKLGLARAARELNSCQGISKSKANVILLPDEQAFEWLLSNKDNYGESQRMEQDNRYKCNVYAYHMLTPTASRGSYSNQRSFGQEQRFQTDYRAPNGANTFVSSIFVRERDGNKLNFNSAVAKTKNPIKFRDGQIYPVQRLNFPPETTMVQIMKDEGNMQEIVNKIESTGIQQEFNQMNGKVLFLAPIDSGWRTRDLENGYSKVQTRKVSYE